MARAAARAAPTNWFVDRHDAGRRLAGQLRGYDTSRQSIVVLGLPRGGVPVAFEVARALRAPLDVITVRKLGVPGREELAFGAIAGGGVQVINAEVVAEAGLTPEQVDALAAAERIELDRRERLYRSEAPARVLEGTTAIIVDDGLATGATMRVAIEAARLRLASRVAIAVPVAAASSARALAPGTDGIFCMVTPPRLVAVANWYDDFTPTSDEEVLELLALARRR
jgi:predicted phosphoribosyltransferase